MTVPKYEASAVGDSNMLFRRIGSGETRADQAMKASKPSHPAISKTIVLQSFQAKITPPYSA
jgi:hypothetical protein